ncbi:MAG: efflux RND transporter permease subunit [Sulfuriflexus sp.]|nr:efflux RND transporter permease subunit [Sulfuriflexus sp.]
MTENNSSQENMPDPGVAGGIAKQFIDSPVTPLLIFAFLAIGILGLMFTPRQEDPKISVPMVDVYVQYPGASAEQVTTLVTEPLERIMGEIPGTRHIYSATMRGAAIVTVRFKVGEELGASIVKVHDKVQSNLDRIPPGVAMPLVKPVGIDDVPIVAATLWSETVDDATLRRLSLDVLQRLSQVPDTGNGFVTGGRTEQIRIEASPERLSGHGITLDELAQTIRTANTELDVGGIESSGRVFTVYSGAFLTTAQDVADLVIGIRDDAPVYVRDVASVTQEPADSSQLVTFYSGHADNDFVPLATAVPAVTIAVAKKVGTNGVTVAESILAKLDSLKGSLIPNDVNVTITRNYGQTADDKVNELLLALFEAAVAVSVLCWIGLGIRAASVVTAVIPIVILVTVWATWILDYTIDRVSLFALVFSIGILVDDATVVVENIFRRWLDAGKTTAAIAVDAVREVGNPTILATLAIISAMLPMGVVSGLMGPYMRPIPVLGSAAMLFSLIAAFVFVPWLAMRVRPKLEALKKAEEAELRSRERIGRFYRPIMMPLCTNRKLGFAFLGGMVLLTFLACSMFYFNAATVKMLPFDNKPEFNVVINMPEGTALPVTANLAAELSEQLRQIPEVTAMQNYAGTSSPFNFNGMVRHYFLRKEAWQADIQVMLTDKEHRERGSHAVAVEARHLLWDYIRRNNIDAKIQIVEMPPGPPVLQTVVAEVYGPDAETRRQVARDMTRMFEDVDNVVDVDNYLTGEYEFWRFEVDVEKAVRHGISVDDINRNLDMAMGDYRLGDVKREAVLEPTWIVMQVPLAVRAQLQRLGNLPIRARDGTPLPLAELGRFVRHIEEPIIYHKDLRAIEYVTGEMEGDLGAPIYGMFGVEDLLENYTTPDGVKITGMPNGLLGPPASDDISGFEWTGEWTVTYETFRDMGAAFMVALLLIYGLIVWEFKNFRIGGLIMAPIPLTLIGIIPGHWVLGAEFTATSMIGFIALAGIIVRNSILLVEFVSNEVKRGTPIREAVISAGQTRMRPILITALTLMAGAAAIVTDPIFQGMAASLLFGTAVATILTLVVIPLGCISAQKQFYLMAGITPSGGDADCAMNDGAQLSRQEQRVAREYAIGDTLLAGSIAIEKFFRALIAFLVGLFGKKATENNDGDNTPPDGSGGSGSGGNGSGDPDGSNDPDVSSEPDDTIDTESDNSDDGVSNELKVEQEETPPPLPADMEKAAEVEEIPQKVVTKKVVTKKAPKKKKPATKKATVTKEKVIKKKTAKKKSRARRGIQLKQDIDE